MSWRFNPFTGKLDRTGDSASGTNVDPSILIEALPCDSSVYVGAAVRMDGADLVVNAQADTSDNANVLGICETKPSSTICSVRVGGVTNSIFVGLDQTKEYFLSSTVAGGISTTPPTPAAGRIVLRVGKPLSATRFLVILGIRLRHS